MIRFYFTLVLAGFLNFAKGQNNTNYIEVRGDYMGKSCGSSNMDSIYQSYLRLKGIDSSKLVKGKFEYFYDLGMMCYNLGFSKSNNDIIKEGINCFLSCLSIKSKEGRVYNNLLIMYYFSKNYEEAKRILPLYKKYEKRKLQDKELIKMIELL